MIRLVRRIATLVVLITGFAATPAVAAGRSPADIATTWYCKVVIASDIRVFKSPTGSAIWGHFRHGAVFYVDRTDGTRYHTQIITDFVVDAWTTSDPRWVTAC